MYLVLQLVLLKVRYFILGLIFQLIPRYHGNDPCTRVLTPPMLNIHSDLILSVQGLTNHTHTHTFHTPSHTLTHMSGRPSLCRTNTRMTPLPLIILNGAHQTG